MRSLSLLVAAMLAVAACQATSLPEFNPAANINALMSIDSAAMTRHFSTLQTTVQVSAANNPCLIPLARLLNVTLPCMPTIQSIFDVDITNATSVTAAQSACSSKCLADMKTLFNSFNSTEKRCTSSYGFYAQLGDVACAKSALKDELCVVTINRATGSCGRQTETSCKARENCVWNTTLSACGANPSPSVALLDSFCGSGCLDKLINAYSIVADATTVESIKASQGAICLKANGVYCAPVYNQYSANARSNDILRARPDFCANSTVFACLRTFTGFVASQAILGADQTYRACIGDSITATSVATAPSDTKKKACTSNHLQTVQAADKLLTLLDVSCATTNGADSGLPCVPLFSNLTKSTTLQTCGQTLEQAGTCSADCDKAFADALGQLGCCGYFIMQIQTNPLPDDKRLPAITGAGTQTYAGATDVKESRPETYWKPCTNTFANKTLIARCSVPEAQRVKKSLKTNLAFAEISKDTALFARLKAALRKDVAVSLGITEDDIVSDDITEDTSRQVTVKAASSRQQSTTEQKKNAAKYDFTLAGKDAATTSAAASRFDSASSAGTLTTSSTASAVAACTSCTDSTTGSLAASSPSGSGTTTTSGAAATAVTLAALAVAALAF